MKKVLIVLGLMSVVVVACFALPWMLDEISWLRAKGADRPGNYARYLRARPHGRHADEARRLYDQRSWDTAQKGDSVLHYRSYLSIHPKGKHVTEAQAKIEQLMWQEALAGNSLYSYERYLKRYPSGKHVTEAHAKIEELDWLQGSSANTIKSCQDYVDNYPQGQFVEQAKSRQKLLSADDSVYAEVQKTGTEQALIRFLEDYPGHKRESDARAALTEIRDGRDIFALIDEGRISLEAQGQAIDSVQVRIRNLDVYPIVLRIPAGTFFESIDASKQNMITTASSSHKLPGGGSITVIVPVACANQFRQIPRKGSGFEIRPNSGQDDLDKLMQVLSEADIDYAAKQAAVWIVTNNASYKGLGRLTRGFGGFGPSVIKADDAAMAVKLCYDAGIPVTQKAIWRDRGTIASEVKDPRLSSWLRERREPYMPERGADGQQILVRGRERGTIQQDILVRPDEREPEAFGADRLSVFVSSSKLYELTQYDKDYGKLFEDVAKAVLSDAGFLAVPNRADAAVNLQVGYGMSFRDAGNAQDNLSIFIRNRWRDKAVVNRRLREPTFDLCLHLYLWDVANGCLVAFYRSAIFPEAGNVLAEEAISRDRFLAGQVRTQLDNDFLEAIRLHRGRDGSMLAIGDPDNAFHRLRVDGPTKRVFVKFDYGPINTYHWLDEDFERYLYSTLLESGWDCVYSSDAADVTLRVTCTKNSRSMRSLTEQRQYNLLTNFSVFEAGQSQKEKAIFSKSVRASSRRDVPVELCRSDTIGQWRQAYESADMTNQIIEALNRASGSQTGP